MFLKVMMVDGSNALKEFVIEVSTRPLSMGNSLKILMQNKSILEAMADDYFKAVEDET